MEGKYRNDVEAASVDGPVELRSALAPELVFRVHGPEHGYPRYRSSWLALSKAAVLCVGSFV